MCFKILRGSDSFRISKASFLNCIDSCRIIQKGKEIRKTLFLQYLGRHILLPESDFELLNIKMCKFRLNIFNAQILEFKNIYVYILFCLVCMCSNCVNAPYPQQECKKVQVSKNKEKLKCLIILPLNRDHYLHAGICTLKHFSLHT